MLKKFAKGKVAIDGLQASDGRASGDQSRSQSEMDATRQEEHEVIIDDDGEGMQADDCRTERQTDDNDEAGETRMDEGSHWSAMNDHHSMLNGTHNTADASSLSDNSSMPVMRLDTQGNGDTASHSEEPKMIRPNCLLASSVIASLVAEAGAEMQEAKKRNRQSGLTVSEAERVRYDYTLSFC